MLVTPALLDRDVLRQFGIRLTLPTDEDTWLETEINAIETRSDSDDLQVNPAIPYETKVELKQIYRELYVDFLRPPKPKTKAELKLRLNDPQPFHCTPRRLSYDKAKASGDLRRIARKEIYSK